MSEHRLKLTAYFGERDRTPNALLADELLGLFDVAGLETGLLLRGAEGFGRLHHLHTDRLLSLSDDLPLIAVALDTPEQIDALLQRVVMIKRRGLLTLERAQLLTREIDFAEPAHQAAADAKLTVYVGRRERVNGRPAYLEVCDLLHRNGVAGASVLLGVDGVSRGRRSRARFFSTNSDVPMAIIAVGSGERIAQVLHELGRLIEQPLITLERLSICKTDGKLLATPDRLPGEDARGRPLWQKLTVYSSQSATHGGRPLHSEIIRRLRASDAAGATVLTGVWGYHGVRQPHGDRLLQIRRQVPTLTIAIDTPERTARSFQIIDELTTEHGLVTSETVPAMRATSETKQLGELRMADPDYRP